MSVAVRDAGATGPLEPTLVADLVGLAVARGATRDALVEASGRTLSWADVEREVGRLATGLGDVGLVAGQRVMLAMGNRVELVTAYLGVLRAQLVAVPVNPRAKVEELAWMIADSGARLVVADGATVADVRAARHLVVEALAGSRDVLDDDVVGRAFEPRLAVVDSEPQAGELAFGDLCADEPRALPTRPDPETLACLLYTGSTVDLPRAAMLTHRALLANVEQAAAVHPTDGPGPVGPGDIVLGVLPFFHVYGLNAVLGSVLRQGATLVLVDRFDPRGSLELIAEHRVSVVPVVPAVFPHWLGVDGVDDA
ncbi:MAG: AMP-binding protein, partial [Nocardioides sp.]